MTLRRSRQTLLTVWALSAILLLSCLNHQPTRPASPGKSPTPQELVSNLRSSYSDRDFGKYRNLLSDDFVFEFLPTNPLHPDSTTYHWGRIDDLASTQKMLGSEQVDGIKLSFTQSGPDSAGSDLPGALRIDLLQVNLKINTRIGGEAWVIQVPDGMVTLFFKQVPIPGGSPQWRIVRWVDDYPDPFHLPTPPARTIFANWGGVKQYFR